MSVQRIDLASIHEIVFALTEKDHRAWTHWQRCAMAEVSMSLLFRRNVSIPAPPGHATASAGNILVQDVLRILEDFVSEPDLNNLDRKEALSEALIWIGENHEIIRDRFQHCRNDPSFDRSVRWHIGNVWPEHVKRHGSLVDEAIFLDVAAILKWSQKQAVAIKRQAKELALVKSWSKDLNTLGELPPEDILDGFALAVLLRGRYYQCLEAKETSVSSIIYHHSRNYLLNGVTTISRLNLVKDHKTEAYLAGLICAVAMQKDNDSAKVCAWAENMRKVRKKTLHTSIRNENDDSKALSQAVEIAKHCDVEIKSKQMEKLLEKTVHWGVLPIIGIASGLSATLASGSHEFGMITHSAAETIARPYVESLKSKFEKAVEGNFHIQRAAKMGLQRIFAVTDSDTNQ